MKRPDYLTLLLVTIVATLIWLVAEANTRKEIVLEARVAFTVADAENYIVEPDHVGVRLTVSGSKQAVGELEKVLKEKVSLALPAKNGTVTISNINKRLEQLPDVANAGAKLLKANPEQVKVDITELVDVKAAVQQRMPEGALVQDPIVSPTEATITLPRNEADQLPDDITLEAVVDSDAIQHLEPGVLHTVNSTIRLPEPYAMLKNVTVSPADARVSFRLVSRRRSVTLDKVYVQVLANPSIADAFRISLPEPVLRNVEVMASIDFADQLEPGPSGEPAAARVVAVLPLTNLELEQGVAEKQVAEFLVLLADGTGREVDATVAGTSHPIIQLVVTPVSPEPAPATPAPTPAPAPATPGT